MNVEHQLVINLGLTMMEGLVGGSSFMFPFPQNPVFLHKLLNTYQSGLN